MGHQGQGPYAKELKKIETDIKEVQKRVNEKMGVKETDTGLAPPNLWDVPADKQRMQEEQPLQESFGRLEHSDLGTLGLFWMFFRTALQVARCTKIIQAGEGEDAKYVINVKQIGKFVVSLGERVAPTDIEEGMRIG